MAWRERYEGQSLPVVAAEVLRCVPYSFLVAWLLTSTALGMKIAVGSAAPMESKLVSLALLPLRSLFYGAVGTYVVAGPVLVLGLLLASFSLIGHFAALRSVPLNSKPASRR